MRVFNQPAYTLINRPYSETSLIVEVFTRDFGRIGLMAKGARRLKSKLKGVLQPFQPILISWTGKGDVPTLTSAEIDQSEFDLLHHELTHDALVCGFYCNELLINLLHRHDPHAGLFNIYNETLMSLNDAVAGRVLPQTLRAFEQSILKETGYEISFLTESDGKTLIDDIADYHFQAGLGFVRLAKAQRNSVKGNVIKSLHGAQSVTSDLDVTAKGKILMRDVLSKTLGNRKIISRDLFFPRQPVE